MCAYRIEFPKGFEMNEILLVLDSHPPVCLVEAVVDYSSEAKLRITFDVYSSEAAEEILVLLSKDIKRELSKEVWNRL